MPVRRQLERMPWPREEGGVQLGVDVAAKRQDIIKIVHKYFRVDRVPMEELLQEVFLAIVHKNRTRSAHDPRKSSFGHYVYLVANNVCINLVHKQRRQDREQDSLDAPGHDDGRTLLETIDVAEEKTSSVFDENLDDVEASMRRRGMWEAARFIRMARSGVPADLIKEAMSWDGHQISNKVLRDIRCQVKMFAEGKVSVSASNWIRPSSSFRASP
jgi:DNA-directed RNA polymerase specialized sigma24 family protein